MRLTFSRMADRRPVETLVERDDGVVFAMRGAGEGPDLPHDVVHALVETELGIADGIWGCVADGVVWNSMRRVSGRQPRPRLDAAAVGLRSAGRRWAALRPGRTLPLTWAAAPAGPRRRSRARSA